LKSKTIDWCSIVSGKSGNGVIVKILIDSLKQVAPEVVHDCPFTKTLELKNYRMPDAFLLLYPVGNFELKISFYSKGREVLKLFYDFILT
jgi:hypothetical protein